MAKLFELCLQFPDQNKGRFGESMSSEGVTLCSFDIYVLEDIFKRAQTKTFSEKSSKRIGENV